MPAIVDRQGGCIFPDRTRFVICRTEYIASSDFSESSKQSRVRLPLLVLCTGTGCRSRMAEMCRGVGDRIGERTHRFVDWLTGEGVTVHRQEHL